MRRISSTTLRMTDFLKTRLHRTAFLDPVVFDGGSGGIKTQVGHLTGYGCTHTFAGGAICSAPGHRFSSATESGFTWSCLCPSRWKLLLIACAKSTEHEHMMISIDTLEPITHDPHEKEYRAWKARLNNEQYDLIERGIEDRLGPHWITGQSRDHFLSQD